MSSSQIQRKPAKRSRASHNTQSRRESSSRQILSESGPSPASRSNASENSPETEMDEDEDYEPIDEGGPSLAIERVEKTQKNAEHEDRAYIEPKKGKGKSEYWNHYKRYLDESDKIRAECIYCQKTFAADSRLNGTKNLSRHWLACLDNPANKSKGTQSKLVLEKVDESTKCKLRNWVLNQNECRDALAKMVIMDELPFRYVEKPGFKSFISAACPTFIVPSRRTVARDCYNLYLHEKVMLKSFLSKCCQRVCLTTDTWTSIQRINYMCITAHFIDNDWRLQRRILNFCPILSHKGDDIARGIEDCLRPWGLFDKVFTLTVDNASANDSAIACLKEMLRANGSCINNAQNLHMRCVAHIANLIVSDGLKLHIACVSKVRNFVKYVRSSPSRLHLFKEQADKLKIGCKSSLTLDVPTRWNSTYLMLEVALQYKNVFARIDVPRGADFESFGHITAVEWKKIEVLVKFLKGFYDFTKDVSGSSYVTVDNVFCYIGDIVSVLNQWMDDDDLDCQHMAMEMKAKCDKYWGDIEKMNMLIFVAIILNPTYKFAGVEMSLQTVYGRDKGEELAKKVKTFADGLFDEYRTMYSPLVPHDQGSEGTSSAQVERVQRGCSKLKKSLNQKIKERNATGGVFKTEFDRYLNELPSESNEDEILLWWKLNEPRFPILARMARDVLAIPITTVPSESAFSTGGRTLDQFRSSLTPKAVQGLICTQDWLHANVGINNAAFEEEDSIEVLEKIEEDVEKDISLSTLSIADKEPICF